MTLAGLALAVGSAGGSSNGIWGEALGPDEAKGADLDDALAGMGEELRVPGPRERSLTVLDLLVDASQSGRSDALPITSRAPSGRV